MRPLVVLLAFLSLGYSQEWLKEVFDSTDAPVFHVSIAVDSSGLPRVAYSWRKCLGPNSYLWALRYAERRGMNDWHIETVDSSVDQYWCDHPALCLDSLDRPHIAYARKYIAYARKYFTSADSFWRICYAARTDSTWHTQVVDSFTLWHYYVGLDLGLSSLGTPHMAYTFFDSVTGQGRQVQLRYATQVADSWQIQVLWSCGFRHAGSPSIVISSEGKPRIAFLSVGPGGSQIDSLLWMWPDTTGWHTSCVDTFLAGGCPSAQLDTADRAHIAYQNESFLFYATQEDTTWHRQIIGQIGYFGWCELKLDFRWLAAVGAIESEIWLPLYIYQDPPGVWHREYVEENPYHPSWSNISLAFNRQNAPFLAYTRLDTFYFEHYVVAQRSVGIEQFPQLLKYSPQFVVRPSISSRKFCFSICSKFPAEIGVYTSQGRRVFSTSVMPGVSTFVWNASSSCGKPLPCGTYFVRFKSGSHVLTRKLIVR
ncbi:hypothetical protein CH330_07125 [candidate division WOR-3 bacterium JGI_Cruoil_03_51_56]|uniref:FlgD Ig-like domain-containing protein n=1 Tax=candidate division WOR-3 bacterium JGI_Cruoil_03_51_56 TaxID=1973747 RepID=A0A235BR49_UNCW3|nr:MAG: hypothetical protein CH330_07125 [candidate division WOR-3 bacterium JGI_Cruoil_03_51_56]